MARILSSKLPKVLKECPHCGGKLVMIRYVEEWDREGNPVEIYEDPACLNCKMMFIEFCLPCEYELMGEVV